MMKQMLVIAAIALLTGGWMEIEPSVRIAAIRQAAATAAVASPVRLTTGGCCTLPFWSPDGQQVRYIDKPVGGKLGIYGVTAVRPEAQPVYVSERVEDSRIFGPYRVEATRTTTTLVRLADGKKFTVPAQGRSVQFSPDYKRIAWNITNQDLPSEQQVAAIWVANVDGSGAKRIVNLFRGSVGGWLSDSALLVSGVDRKDRTQSVLYSLSIADGKLTEILRGERLRSATLSPSGRWLAYYTTFNKDGGNGLWIADTLGGKPKAAPAGAFGAYQWRPGPAGDRLVVVPFKPDAQFHEFWQLDPASLALTQLTQAATAPVKIANGDWRVSPDGRYVTYVESKDRNIWLVELR